MNAVLSVQVGMSAFALAMKAKSNQADEMDVEEVVTLAQQMLPSSDPLHRAVTSFATEYQLIAHDADRLRVAGEELSAAVEQAIQPVVPGSDRVDIYG